MVTGVGEPPGYAQAIKTFQKLDKADGKEDGVVSLTGKSPKHAQKYQPADLNRDQNITLGEFLLYQLARTDPKIKEKIDTFRKTAQEAGWTDSEINTLLQIVFSGGGANISDVLTEINYFGSAEVLKEFKAIVLIEKGSPRPLLECINSAKEPSPTKLNRLLNTIAALFGCFDYYKEYADITKPFETVRNTIILTLIMNPIKNRGGRELFTTLCMHRGEELLPEDIRTWVSALNSHPLSDDEKIRFLAAAIARGKIKTVEDLNAWIEKVQSGDKDLGPLWDLLPLLNPNEAEELASIHQSLETWQQDILRSLIEKGWIASFEELKEILPYLVKPNTDEMVYHLDYAFMLPAETVAYTQIISRLSQSGDAVGSIIDYIESLNNSDVSREEGYAGDQATIQGTLNWDRILYFVGKTTQGRTLEQMIAARLEKEAASLSRDADQEIKAFFKRIPNQDALETLIYSDTCGKKIKYWIKTHWKLVRPFLGHIFLRNAKSNQHLRLKEHLEKQGIKLGTPTDRRSFQASVEVVNLDTMQRGAFPTSFVILGKNQVLVTIDFAHGQQSAVINPENPASWRDFMRSTAFKMFPEGTENPYLVFYPPKITFVGENQYTVSTDYQVHEGNPETLVGKGSPSSTKGIPTEQQHRAYEVFRTAQQQEDAFLAEGKPLWTRYGFMYYKIRLEDYISLEQLFSLMRVMDTSGAKKTTGAVFGISEEEYNRYEKVIHTLLSHSDHLTPEQFLGRAIEAFQGNVMLASVISYNTLWKIRGTLLSRYPNAFKMPQNTSDPVGAIYHFFGTFFAGYAMQKCLVWRYHHDAAFKAEIDAKVKELKKRMKVDLEKQSIEGLDNEELLLFFQYRLLQLRDESSIEITALAGIFKEEVVEDGDTSREVEFDLRGASSAHALFETVYGVELASSSDDNYRGLIVKLMGKFIGAPVKLGFQDKLALKKLLDIPLTDLLSSIF